MVAIKRIRLEGLKEEEVTDVMREVDLLQSLSHPSIVKYEGMSRDADYLNIVMEWVARIPQRSVLKYQIRREWFAWSDVEGLWQVQRASCGQLCYEDPGRFTLSSFTRGGYDRGSSLYQVVHCDLKAANILSTKNGNIKLSDFGVSLNMKAVENIKNDAETFSRTGKPVPVKDVAGTPHWSTSAAGDDCD